MSEKVKNRPVVVNETFVYDLGTTTVQSQDEDPFDAARRAFFEIGNSGWPKPESSSV